MHNIMRFIRQNKKQIIRIAVIAAFLFLILQILNYLTENNKNINVNNNKEQSVYEKTNGTVVSDKSMVSGGKVSTSTMQSVNDIIKEFVENCNNQKIEEAYNMLTDECKEVLYPDIETFENNYYNNLFKESNLGYSIENWSGDIYIVKYMEDMLSTGKITTDNSYSDYITIVNKDGNKKLNINRYIGRKILNKSKDSDNIKTEVLYSDKYMDYEIYKLKITNNTDNTILLDPLTEVGKIYLKDSNDVRHKAYTNEIVKDNLKIYAGHTSTIEIKFDNPYISDRDIKSICFSNIVLYYSEANKGAYKKIKYIINL